MTSRTMDCIDCGELLPYGRLSCPACGALLASVAGANRGPARVTVVSAPADRDDGQPSVLLEPEMSAEPKRRRAPKTQPAVAVVAAASVAHIEPEPIAAPAVESGAGRAGLQPVAGSSPSRLSLGLNLRPSPNPWRSPRRSRRPDPRRGSSRRPNRHAGKRSSSGRRCSPPARTTVSLRSCPRPRRGGRSRRPPATGPRHSPCQPRWPGQPGRGIGRHDRVRRIGKRGLEHDRDRDGGPRFGRCRPRGTLRRDRRLVRHRRGDDDHPRLPAPVVEGRHRRGTHRGLFRLVGAGVADPHARPGRRPGRARPGHHPHPDPGLAADRGARPGDRQPADRPRVAVHRAGRSVRTSALSSRPLAAWRSRSAACSRHGRHVTRRRTRPSEGSGAAGG